MARRYSLQRIFSTFPGGLPGTGLLLLRATVGITACVEGGVYLVRVDSPTFSTWTAGLLALAGGVSLLIGFVTPAASVLVGLGNLGIMLSFLPMPTSSLLGARHAIGDVVIIAVAITLLGPGAFSVDARLFGRR